MKKILIILLLSAFGFPAIVASSNVAELAEMATAQKKSTYTLKDLESLEGASVVFISKMMLSLAKGSVGDMGVSDIDIKGLMNDLTGIHIINIENPKSTKKALEILSSAIKADDYEIVMKMKEAGSDELTFYHKVAKGKEDAELMMVVNEEGGELSIMRFKGSINFEKLKQLTN